MKKMKRRPTFIKTLGLATAIAAVAAVMYGKRKKAQQATGAATEAEPLAETEE